MKDKIIHKEVKVIENLIEKIKEIFPGLIIIARDEFLEFYGKDIIENIHCGQYFYSWFFSNFILNDGKNMVCLCYEILDLNKKEKLILENIRKGINGFFNIIKIRDNEIDLIDLLTKKEYSIYTFDLDDGLEEGRIIEAELVKNFDNKYFFFGGIRLIKKSRIIELNLLEYSRDLDVDELVEKEMLIIDNFKDIADIFSLESYLEEAFERNDEDIQKFLSSSKSEQEDILRDKIIEYIKKEPVEIV